MTMTRAVRLTLVSFIAILTLVPCSPAQGPRAKLTKLPDTSARDAVDQDGMSCVLYSLNDLAEGPNVGEWIADTLPTVIQPSSWSQVGGAGVVSYNGPTKMMVVYQAPAVHAQIERFLANVKKSLPKAKTIPMNKTEAEIAPV